MNIGILYAIHAICSCPSDAIKNTDCTQGRNKINNECHCKQQECKVGANNRFFDEGIFDDGDPCKGTRKYLNITWICVAVESQSGIAGTHLLYYSNQFLW